jgi:hypothetical protein
VLQSVKLDLVKEPDAYPKEACDQNPAASGKQCCKMSHDDSLLL